VQIVPRWADHQGLGASICLTKPLDEEQQRRLLPHIVAFVYGIDRRKRAEKITKGVNTKQELWSILQISNRDQRRNAKP
jgi:hypothetical protein